MNDFEKEMLKNGVEPLKKNNRVVLKTPHHTTPKKVINISPPFKQNIDSPVIGNFNITTALTSNELIDFSQHGVQPKTIKKLKQGNLSQTPPCLDLHGYKVEEAKIILSNFVNQSQSRYLQIIHGKGYNSPEPLPILKNLVASFLYSHPLVLAVCSCPINDGGAGAVFILLKKK